MARSCGIGVVNGPRMAAAPIHPPAASVVTAAYRRSISVGSPARPPNAASAAAVMAAMTRTSADQCRWPGMQPARDAEDGAGRVERGEFGAVPPRPAEDQDRGGFGELVVAGDEHHGLHAAAAYPPSLAAHPGAGWSRAAPRIGRELAAGLEFVPQVGQRVGFAVEVGGDDGPGRGEQVRPVQAGVGEFGAEPGDLGGQGGGVGERGFELLPDLGERGRCGREPGDDAAGGVVSGGCLLKINDRVLGAGRSW